METLKEVEELVEYLAKSVVVNKDAVSVHTEKDDDFNIIMVDVADEDVGRIIGKHGKIAQSIRTLVYSINHTGERLTVKFANNNESN